jgi:fido (protein-threonine AMPylation protein)
MAGTCITQTESDIGANMRQFDYISIASAATDPQTAERLARINRVKDLAAFRAGYTKRELDQLRLRTLAEDGRTSCALSGIIVPAQRIRGLVAGDFAPARTDEHEVVGVLRTLNTIEYQYRSTHVSPGVIMLLHKRMLFDVDRDVAGRWRTADDDAAWAAEHPVVSPDDLPFEIPPASEVEMLLHNLCTALRRAQRGPHPTDPIVQAAAFLCDFENIHPFAVGSGRMARIMLQLLLLKGDCLIGLYQSIDQAIHRSRADFRAALRESSVGWARGENDYAPIVNYLVCVIDSCYELHGDYERESADATFKAQAAQVNASNAAGAQHTAGTRTAQAAGSAAGARRAGADAAPVVARASHPTHEQSRAAAHAGYVPVAQRAAAAEGKPAHDQTAAERIEALARERIAAMRDAKERARREEEKRQAEEKRVAEAAAAAAAAARAASPVLSGAFAPMEEAPVVPAARKGKNRAGRSQGSSAAGNASASATTAGSSSAGASDNPRIARSHAAAAPAQAHNARIRRSEGTAASSAPASSAKRASAAGTDTARTKSSAASRASGASAARSGARPSNEQIIRDYFARTKGEVSKQEILDANPVMSKKTLERILKTLREDGTVEMIGAARSSRYRALR